MTKPKIAAVIGARPQFIKHAPIEMAFHDVIDLVTIHTGQHYDKTMSDIFFNQLSIPKEKYNLAVGSHKHGMQTAMMIQGLEPIFEKEKPQGVLIYGDTNSTLAAAITAVKMDIPVFHVEAGLRSFNRSMPEEINRILADHISALLLAPSQEAVEHLKNEGIADGVIYTGDIMRDMLRITMEKNLVGGENKGDPYFLCTLHRPYNTDDPERLYDLLNALDQLDYEVRFPMHPRTSSLMVEYNINIEDFSNIRALPPVGYIEILNLLVNSVGLITDSGGMQKEAYWLKKKCVTIRTETEWRDTLTHGWNVLVFDHLEELNDDLVAIEPGYYDEKLYGDGFAASRIRKAIADYLD